MRKTILNIFIALMCLLTLTGCSINLEEKPKDLMKEKTISELNFIEDAIFNIVNKYAKGEYLKDEELDWNNILEDEKKINEVLDTIILDFLEMNISKENLVEFSNELNLLLTSSMEKDEENLLNRLQILYSKVPQFLNEFLDDKNEIKDKELKLIVLTSLSYANINEWESAKETIDLAVTKYNEMLNDVDYMQTKSDSLNRGYVLLGEVKNAIDLENLELLKLKYVNFIEKF